MTERDPFLNRIQNYKTQIRLTGKKAMLSRMVYQNIKEFIPESWKIEYSGWYTGFKISPVEEDVNMSQEFVKLTKKLAKVFNREPDIDITESNMGATFFIHLRYNDDYRWESICVDIYVGNTEKCEVVIKKTMKEVEERELTGYCKHLKELKFLQETN
jgi:DUF4097 and DUF4098 domain-containing protein YvlB